MSKRERMQNVYGLTHNDEIAFLEPEYFDEAIIGLAQNEDTMMVVYSEPCIMRLLREKEGMTPDAAVEHFNRSIWYQENILFVDNEVLN